jgi:type II secretory pathway pseudopilin PulG
MRKTKGSRRQSAFTLIELVVIVTILGILSFTALSRFINVRDAAHSAVADGVVAGLRSGASLYRSHWFSQGSPGKGNTDRVDLVVDGISVRYRNGQVVNVNTSNHVPVGTPNRTSANTKIFHLFLATTPDPIIARNSAGTGWVMLANGQCAAVTRPRCWEYRVNGNREARLTYASGEDGRIIVD